MWRGLVARGTDAVLVFDAAGRCTFASDSAGDLFDGPAVELVGRTLDELVTEPDGTSVAGRVDRAHARGDEFTASARTAAGPRPVRAAVVRHDDLVSVALAGEIDPDRAGGALERRLQLEHLIEGVQSRFIHTEPHRSAEVIDWALEEIGRFLGADRAYVLTFDDEARTESMTHEWVSEARFSELDTYVGVPWEAAPAASERNAGLGISAVPDVSQLDGEWAADRAFFEAAGILSILELPLIIDAHPVGALGFDWLTTLAEWTEDELTLLRILASSFAQLLGRAAADRELRHREDHDALTGLLNRHGIARRLRERLATASDTSSVVVCLDVDNFKVVNDSLGPTFADELLVAVGRRLRDLVRSEDLVARIGGDEFCLVLDASPEGPTAAAVVERLRLAMSDPYVVDGRTYQLTVSCGIAQAHPEEAAAEPDAIELLRRASAAVVRAKELGRSRQEEFDAELESQVARRLQLDQELRGALARGEFEVHYQAEHDLVTGRVVGAEALLRWRRDGRIVAAGEFIDLVESTGLILEVGPWVLATACAQAKHWIDAHDLGDFVVRVNLSVRQLEQPDVVEVVRAALEDCGLEPHRLCLEITETVLMADPERARVALDALDRLGVELAIDDFGTGYSSLAYLKRFPFDILKIDRSFVDGLPHDSEDLAIVRSVIALASALGMRVTAEGIESDGQIAALIALGCPRGQGFLLARPAPPGELEAHLLGHRSVPQPR